MSSSAAAAQATCARRRSPLEVQSRRTMRTTSFSTSKLYARAVRSATRVVLTAEVSIRSYIFSQSLYPLRIDVTDRRMHHTGGGGVRLGWAYLATAKVPSETASPAMTDQVIALIQSREVALQRALHAWPEDLSTVTRPASQCGKYAVRHESHTRYSPRRA